MIRYITRHGQVADYVSRIKDGHLYAPGDVPLSKLGHKQAKQLGMRLRDLGFKGKIISSPYLRTLQTSEEIARVTGTQIIPFALMREIIQSEGHAKKFVGMTIEQIREKIEFIDPTAELAYPWWGPMDGGEPRIETVEEVRERCAKGWKMMNEMFPDTELLLVGHGASAGQTIGLLEIPAPTTVRSMLFNCSLSMVDTDNPDVKPFRHDTSHMKYEETTSNYLYREQVDADYFAREWEHDTQIPEGVFELKGPKILHIGDTYSRHYGFYRKLIEQIKPDIILHTGDLSDETKVGRIPGTEYEYYSKIKRLLGVMNDSGARLIIVPGNNDLPDVIHRLSPKAEIYPVNTKLNLYGVDCRVGHQVSRMTYDTDWSFYGHGLTGESWHLEDNVEGQPCRFNVSWGSFVYSLTEGKFFHIPKP